MNDLVTCEKRGSSGGVQFSGLLLARSLLCLCVGIEGIVFLNDVVMIVFAFYVFDIFSNCVCFSLGV